MSKYEPEQVGSRLLDGCVAVLLGAMALYGAVQIVQAIWLPLCLLFAVVGLRLVGGDVLAAALVIPTTTCGIYSGTLSQICPRSVRCCGMHKPS